MWKVLKLQKILDFKTIFFFIFQSKQLEQKNPKVNKTSTSPKPKTVSTFSLRNLLQSKVLIPGKLKKFQSFSLHNMKTIEAAVKSIQTSEVQGTFHCNECSEKWALNSTNWPDIARHVIQNSGTFSKHLSPMIDQHLVILSTEQNGQNLNTWTSVLKCRKCKFYLDGNLENHACFTKSARSACALCNKRHAGGPSEECGRALTRALAISCRKSCLKCDSKAVNPKNCENHTFKSETLQTIAKCFATLTNAFNEDTNDTIEELIVASKQKIL